MLVNSKNQGFTLIETLIYIALFALMLGSAFITAYELIDSSRNLNDKNTTQEEGNFVMRKLDWALANIDPAQSITPSSGTSDTLSVTKYDGNRIDVRLNSGKIEMRESMYGDTYIPLTTSHVSVSSIQFTYIPAVDSAPIGVAANVTIDGKNFTVIRYIRK